ncbi:hypothetical protein GCM10022222_48380 [Amycolatopsis ultiminotia]|uniref:Membrane protein involved in the export of O-antigen and teichoic acid n=1 Tax=Amycolatopsis ultiminotia TaxID=543629 RepID=A0ABP6X518_9PSEU
MSTPVTEESSLARETGRSVGKIGISLLVAIGLGYVFTFVSAIVLGPVNNAVFASFWGILMGLGGALSPLEQELSRQSAVAAVEGHRVGRSALRVLAVGMAVVALAAAITLVVPVLNDRFYGGHIELGIITLCGGIAFACQFATRGLLVGGNAIKPYSRLVVAEAAVRAVLMGLVVVSAISGVTTFAIAAAAGSFAWLLFARPARRMLDFEVNGEGWRPVTARMLLLLLGAGLTASVITGYPALVRVLAPGGDEHQVGILFAALQVSRVPLLLLTPLQALAVPTVVRLSGTADGMHRLRRLIAFGALGTIGVGVLGVVVGWLIGPWLVQLLFRAQYAGAQGWWIAGMVWGAVLLTALQLMTAVLVARTQANRVLVTWAVVAVTTALVLLLVPGDTVLRAVLGLAIGPTAGLVVALGFVLRRPGNVPDVPGV